MQRSRPRRSLHETAFLTIARLMREQGKNRKQLAARWQRLLSDLGETAYESWEQSFSRWFRGKTAMPEVLIDDLAAWLETDQAILFRPARDVAPAVTEEDVVLAPRLGRGVARDSGGGYRGEYPTEPPIPVPARAARGRGLGAVEVTGDCLLPDLSPGQIAIVAHHQAVPGQIVAVELLATGECLLKRYAIEDGSIRLRGNEGEGTLYDPEDIDILGPVIGVYTPW